jgi:hypothetical protein
LLLETECDPQGCTLECCDCRVSCILIWQTCKLSNSKFGWLWGRLLISTQ